MAHSHSNAINLNNEAPGTEIHIHHCNTLHKMG